MPKPPKICLQNLIACIRLVSTVVNTRVEIRVNARVKIRVATEVTKCHVVVIFSCEKSMSFECMCSITTTMHFFTCASPVSALFSPVQFCIFSPVSFWCLSLVYFSCFSPVHLSIVHRYVKLRIVSLRDKQIILQIQTQYGDT